MPLSGPNPTDASRRLLETTPLPMALLTPGGGITQLNGKFIETFGYSPDDIPTLQTWWPRAYPDPVYRQKVIDDWCGRMLQTSDGEELPPYEARVTCQDGSVRTILWRGSNIGTHFLVVGTDVTEQLQATEALRASEERFRLLVENSTELVAQVDTQGLFVYASPNHLSITGYAPAEMLGRNVFEFIHPADAESVQQAFRSPEQESTRIFRYRFKDGSWHWLEAAGRRYRTSAGREMAAVISRDITPRMNAEDIRKQLEGQLRDAQKMEAIGTLAGGIAHDFNNILTGLFGSLQLAEDELPRDHAVRPLLAASFRACERARDLVAKILTFSRRREQQIDAHVLGPIVREVVGLLRASLPATIEIRTSLAAGERTILCDPVQMHQVIMNLATNSAYAMRDRGGRLTIAVDEQAPDATVLASHSSLSSGRLVRLTVADNGIGMDAVTRTRIFEPFYTTKPLGEGTGLGLAVVHGIIENHRGAIAVESFPGIGTTVHVWLPAAESAARRGSAAPFPVPRGTGQRILFIDDEVAVTQIADRILHRLGYEVLAFHRPAEALEAFRLQPETFALIISDLTMPEITGTTVVQEVRRLRPEVPIVITTGYLRTSDVEPVRAMGVRYVLEKPFTMETLAENVRRALNGE